MKTALIFGVTGQDGSYLSKLLLEKDYKVYGVKRRSSTNNMGRLVSFEGHPNLTIVEGDITDPACVYSLISSLKPDECYNLAAQSHVKTSFGQPCYTTDVDYGGVIHILEAIRMFSPSTRFYQASTSEMFGVSYDFSGSKKIQIETTVMMPQSPYGIAKLAAHHAIRLYRQSYGIFACSGILFNHESPYRGEEFVTRKISKYVAELGAARDEKLHLGNLDAKRDWGFAGDYVKGMWLMLQQNESDDFVLATGETHSVREFAEVAFKEVNLDWKEFVVHDDKMERPSEVDYLCGDATKAKMILGWEPTITFKELIKLMVEYDRDELYTR